MAKRVAALFDIDGTAIITGGAGPTPTWGVEAGQLVGADGSPISRWWSRTGGPGRR
jgi:hypothetical protein